MKQRYRYFLFAHSFVCGRKRGNKKKKRKCARKSAAEAAAFSLAAKPKMINRKPLKKVAGNSNAASAAKTFPK